MVYLFTHSYREGGPNPCHTNKGFMMFGSSIMMSIVSLIRFHYKKPAVYSGKGKRFREMYDALKEQLWPRCLPKYSSIFGGEEAKKSKRKRSATVLSDGTEIPSGQYLDLIEFQGKGFDAWEILRNLPDGSIILTGRQFCKCLGVKSNICSVYEADPATKKFVCVIKEGMLVGKASIF